MLTRLFRTHSNIQLIIVILGSLLLWCDGFYHGQAAMQGNELSPLYNLLFSWTFSNGVLSTIIAFAFVLGTALLWNYILVNDGLLPRNTYMPAMVTIVLLSYIPMMLRLTPLMPATLFLLMAIHLLLRSGPHDKAYQDTFSAGLLFSLAAMTNIYHVVFIPLIWISLMLYRSYSIRVWIISVLGIITPVLYLAFYFYWNDHLVSQLQLYIDFFRHFRFLAAFQPQQLMTYIIIGLITLLFLPAFFRFVGRLNEKLIVLRKSSMVIVWFFLLGFFSLAVIQKDLLINGSVMLFGSSVFISSYIFAIKKKQFAELLLWLLLAAIVAGKILLPLQ